MKACVVFAMVAAVLFAGALPAQAAKPSVALTETRTTDGSVALAACGLRTAYGRIVAVSPSNAVLSSGDVATQDHCVRYSFAPPQTGVYSAQAYRLVAPGKKPHIVASITFGVS